MLGKVPFKMNPIVSSQMTYFQNAERLNGLLAMLGIVAALGSYALTGQIIPGIW